MSRLRSCLMCGSLDSETLVAPAVKGEASQREDCATQILPSHRGGIRGQSINRVRYRVAGPPPTEIRTVGLSGFGESARMSDLVNIRVLLGRYCDGADRNKSRRPLRPVRDGSLLGCGCRDCCLEDQTIDALRFKARVLPIVRKVTGGARAATIPALLLTRGPLEVVA